MLTLSSGLNFGIELVISPVGQNGSTPALQKLFEIGLYLKRL
jgi:hypothetical protein